MMRILLLGKNGQVGWELQRALAPLGAVVATDSSMRTPECCGDLNQPELLAQSILQLRPQVIVNAAAYTAVDKAESEPDLAERINHHAVAQIAQAAQQCGALLVHYSTDYVFDGSGSQARDESAATAPVNVYGASKLRGEQAIEASGCQHVIFRTSWVYATRGANFLKTMLRLASERSTLRVVADQIGTPTAAELIADVTAHAIKAVQAQASLGGLYHLTASGYTNWHAYASLAIAHARALGWPLALPDEQAIEPIAAAQFPTPAARPANSRMSHAKLCQQFGLQMPDWQTGVQRVVAELVERK